MVFLAPHILPESDWPLTGSVSWAAVIEYHALSGIHDRNLVLTDLEVQDQSTSMGGLVMWTLFLVVTSWLSVHTEREISPLILEGCLSHHENISFLTSSNPQHLPETLPPNSIYLRVRVSTYEFRGNTNMQFFLFIFKIFFFLVMCCTAYEMLVPWPGIEPVPLHWKQEF